MATATTTAPTITLPFTRSRSGRLAAAGERLAKHGRELRRFHVAHDAEVALFLPGRVVKRDGRRPENAEVLEQRPIVRVVPRDVGAQENGVAERRLHGAIREGVALHLLTRGAPVRVEVE